MKSKIIFLTLIFGLVFGAHAQKSKQTIEVLYFKANLACCKARACNALESELKTMIETNFVDGNVVFKVVKIADEQNKDLVQQYNAQSQSIVIVKKKKKIDAFADVSNLAKEYVSSGDKEAFEAALVAKINAVKKM